MMDIAVLGTGMVGQAIGGKLASLGHRVTMGARDAANEKARAFAEAHGGDAATFADAVGANQLVFNCLKGEIALEALQAIGNEIFAGRVLVDISNPLDFSGGFPPKLAVANTDSLAEQIQRAVPDARVVKTLNMVTAPVMVEPARAGGQGVMFVAGNDEAARALVTDLLRSFGWPEILDLGDLTGARAMEMMMPIWLRLYSALGSADFSWGLNRPDK